MYCATSSFLATDRRRSPRRRWSWAPGGFWQQEAVAQQLQGIDPVTAEGKLKFFVLWSSQEPPRQLSRKCDGKCFQIRLPLPLPKHLVIFGLGDWGNYSQKVSITVEIWVNPDIKPQRIGELKPEKRCLVWEGDWRLDILMASFKQAENGYPFKLLLRVKEQLLISTPNRPCQAPELNQSPVLAEETISSVQGLAESTEAKSQCSVVSVKEHVPEKKFSPPMEKLLMLPVPATTATQQEREEVQKKTFQPNPVQLKTSRRVLFEPLASNGDQETEDFEVKELQICPSSRWCHAMCLSDPETAVLIGGEGANQQFCKDALWKLEIDNDFWFPMAFPAQNSMPQCSRGHSATYDPDTKRIYIFGGMREGKRYSSIHILDTAAWKWLHVPAKGKAPTLAYHSATIYRKELFIFGGAFPKMSSLETGACSNELYIFNPEYEIWYQPIFEGEKPPPRFGGTPVPHGTVIENGCSQGLLVLLQFLQQIMELKAHVRHKGVPKMSHSATLLRNKLIIFGGQRTTRYLNDTHILDLGFMEYTSVPFQSGHPSARSLHAAVPVSDKKLLISGGRNAKGAFSDAFTFHLDSLTWNTVMHSDLCSVPRAGHTLLTWTSAYQTEVDKERWGKCSTCTVLIFGGSDCAGKFYNSTSKIQLEPEEVMGISQNPL